MKLFSKLKISETLVIALIPLIGYVVALFYQIGRFSVLNVPLEYIQLNTELILLCSIFAFPVAVAIFTIWFAFSSIKKRKGNLVVKANLYSSLFVVVCFPIFTFILFYLITNLSAVYLLIACVILFILLLGLIFLPPLIQFPNEKSYKASFERYHGKQYKRNTSLAKSEKKSHSQKLSIWTLFDEDKDSSAYLYPKIAIVLLILAFSSLLIGSSSVSNYLFLVANIDQKEFIVLGMYYEKLVLVGINREKMSTTDDLLFLSKDKEDLLFKMEVVGSLNQRSSILPKRDKTLVEEFTYFFKFVPKFRR